MEEKDTSSKMRNPSALHDEVDDTEKPLAEDKPLFPSLAPISPNQRPEKLTEASTINGVSCHPLTDRHHHARIPPIVRASVNDGTLYMPSTIS